MKYMVKVKNHKNAQYVQIMETKYVPELKRSKQTTYETFGNIVPKLKENPNFLKEIYDKVNNLNNNLEQGEQYKIDKQSEKTKQNDNKTRIIEERNCEELEEEVFIDFNYGVLFYRKFWEKLKLDALFKHIKKNSTGKNKINYPIDSIAFLLSSSRILNPKSKIKTYRTKDSFILDNSMITNKDMIYNFMKHIGKHKNKVVDFLNENLETFYSRPTIIALYDVTTFYFESFTDDGLREHGMSKDHKKNETQVVLALLVDSNGIPFNYELFPGNTHEMKTLLPVVEEFKKKYGLERVRIIADRGLNSGENLLNMLNNGFDYIVAQSIYGSTKQIKELVFSDNWDYIAKVDDNEIFKYKVLKAEDIGKDHDYIVTWSSKRAYHDKEIAEKLKNNAMELLKKGDSSINSSFTTGKRAYIKKRRKPKSTKNQAQDNNQTYEFNSKKYDWAIKTAGYYAFVSSDKETDPMLLYKNLRQLWRIEECFRVMKTNLETRPVFVWNKESIKTHFLICYIALFLERVSSHLVKNCLDISNHKIIDILKELYFCGNRKNDLFEKASFRDMSLEQAREYNSIGKKLFEIAGMEPLNNIETRESIYRKTGIKYVLKH